MGLNEDVYVETSATGPVLVLRWEGMVSCGAGFMPQAEELVDESSLAKSSVDDLALVFGLSCVAS